MSKNKLAEKALKTFLKSIKKIKSIDIKKGLSESGKVLSRLTLIAKAKKDDSKKKKEDKNSKAENKSKKKSKSKVKSSDKSKNEKTIVKKVDVKSKTKKSSASEEQPKKTEAKPEKPAEAKKKVEEKPKSVPTPTLASTAKTLVTKKKAEIAPKKVETNPKPASATKPQAPKPVVTKRTVSTRRTAKPTVGDNLKLIEGIGPKIESFLKEDGTDTFEKLAKANPEDIKIMMVEKGGTRYNANNPTTWPEQAALAAKGDMEGLNALKEELKGGVKPA